MATAMITPAVTAFSPPKFQGLGFVQQDARYSSALDVSRDGSVIVGMAGNGDGFNSQGFYWTEEAGMKSIGDFDGGPAFGECRGVSADGRTIVGSAWDGNAGYPFMWTAETGLVKIEDLPGGAPGGLATAVSANGKYVVGISSSERTGSEQWEAFRWTTEGGIHDLGDAGDRFAWWANGVSDTNTIVGNTLKKSGGGSQAYRWTEEDGIQNLGYLKGGNYSLAHEITPDGKYIVGHSHAFEKGKNSQLAFRWTEADGLVPLVDITKYPTGTEMHGMDISDDGALIVGTASITAGAFLWTEDLGVRRLLTYISKDLGLKDEVAGWRLDHARAISGDGSTIVGYGRNPDGDGEAWMLRIPEPSAALIMLFGIATLGRPRR